MSVSICHKTMLKVSKKSLWSIPQDIDVYTPEQLISALKEALNEQQNLEKISSNLTEELKSFKNKLADYHQIIVEDRKGYSSELDKLKKQNAEMSCQLEKKTEDIEEYKRRILELNSLLTEEKEKTEETKKKLQSSEVFKARSEESLTKYNKYKGKLRYAIGLINELNNMLIKCTSKPKVVNSSTQTNFQINKEKIQKQKPITQKMSNEDIILSDIFFKSRTFCDKEMVLFKHLNP